MSARSEAQLSLAPGIGLGAVGGDQDTATEPNEDWSLSVGLKNDGAATVTGVSATLTGSTPGLFILQGTATYPDISAGATQSANTPFYFHVGGAIPCGSALAFNLHVTYANGPSPQDLPVGFNLSQPCDAPVIAGHLAATKTVAGAFSPLGQIVYTVTLTNDGTGIVYDNSGGPEFSDTMPAQVTVGTPTATAGIVSGPGISPVTWNGLILPGASVTLTIPATINGNAGGAQVSNQGQTAFDTDYDGAPDANALSDLPGGPADEPTVFLVAAFTPAIPTLSTGMLTLLAVLVGAFALRRVRATH